MGQKRPGNGKKIQLLLQVALEGGEESRGEEKKDCASVLFLARGEATQISH